MAPRAQPLPIRRHRANIRVMTDQSIARTTHSLGALKVGVAIIAVIMTAFALWALRQVLTPFILAIFLLLMIGGLEATLKRNMPLADKAALPVAIIAVVTFFGLALWIIIDNITGIVRESGLYATRVDTLLQMGAQALGMQAAPTLAKLIHDTNPAKYVGSVAGEAGHLVEAFVFVLIYLGFMLASRKGFQAKVKHLFGGADSEAATIVTRIQRGVESYIWVQTIVGIIIAGASALLIWPTGLSHVLFWAFVIFLANYIPAIGAAIGVLLPPLFGLLELDAVWISIALLVGLEAVHFTVSHVVQPRMQGQSLNIDPIVVLLSLAFWGIIFGIGGAFLSTPLTVVVMAICAEFPASRGIAVLLSQDGKPFAP